MHDFLHQLVVILVLMSVAIAIFLGYVFVQAQRPPKDLPDSMREGGDE
jgi:hypothetical protein